MNGPSSPFELHPSGSDRLFRHSGPPTSRLTDGPSSTLEPGARPRSTSRPLRPEPESRPRSTASSPAARIRGPAQGGAPPPLRAEPWPWVQGSFSIPRDQPPPSDGPRGLKAQARVPTRQSLVESSIPRLAIRILNAASSAPALGPAPPQHLGRGNPSTESLRRPGSPNPRGRTASLEARSARALCPEPRLEDTPTPRALLADPHGSARMPLPTLASEALPGVPEGSSDGPSEGPPFDPRALLRFSIRRWTAPRP